MAHPHRFLAVLLYSTILTLGLAQAYVVRLRFLQELDQAQARYVAESHATAQNAAERITSTLRSLYEGMRTIARVPGVRTIDRHALHFTDDARATVQEIYNNLANRLSLSEIYIVPKDLEPDQIDPYSGRLQTPITTFDELIVGRTAEPHDEAQQVPEIEIYEYRLMKAQLKDFMQRVPLEKNVRGLDYPASTGPEVVTCDNSRYKPSAPNDADRSGIVYSVPFFDVDGRLKGAISGVILTLALRDLIPGGQQAIVNSSTGYVAGSREPGIWQHSTYVERAEPDPQFIYSEAIALSVVDTTGRWRLWSSRPNSDFTSRADVQAAYAIAWISGLVVAVVTAALALLVHSYLSRQRRIIELDERVRKRTFELEHARDEALAASRAKSAFLANMSHEIRTPMNGVLGMTELLQGTTLNDKQRHYTSIIQRSGEALLVIINDILDFSKIDAGAVTLEAIRFDVHLAIEDTMALLATRAAEKKLSLSHAIATGVPRYWIGDPTRLRQILMNVLANAIKFTEHGRVVLQVNHLHNALEFTVTDSGIGIAPSAVSRLFAPFSQADVSTTRRFGGTGLGLAMTKALVTMMGGAIDLTSELGRGTRVWLRIPRAVEAAA